MEKYSLEKAQEEAEKMRKEVETHSARNYDEAERKVEWNSSKGQERIFSILNTLETIKNGPDLPKEEKEQLVESIASSEDFINEAFLPGNDPFNTENFLMRVLDTESMPNRLKDLALSITEKNLPLIEADIQKNYSTAYGASLVIESFIKASVGDGENERRRESGLLILRRNVSYFRSYIEETKDRKLVYFSVLPLETLIEYGNQKDKDIATDIINEALYDEMGNSVKNYILFDYLFYSEKLESRRFAEIATEKQLARYGLNANLFIKKWDATKSRDSIVGPNVASNLYRMTQIEKTKPGITQVLNKEFGIFDFGRYPEDLLVRQFDQRDSDNLPYGVILFPENDHNEAFYQDVYVFKKLYSQLMDKYEIRIAEVSDKVDAVKRLANFSKRYGHKYKIAFAVIGGHGTTDSIRLGNGDEKSVLKLSDLIDPRASKTGSYFEDDSTFILASCSTGGGGEDAENIAKQIAQTSGKKVIAPDKDANMKSISVTTTDVGLDFQVSYRSFSSNEKPETKKFGYKST